MPVFGFRAATNSTVWATPFLLFLVGTSISNIGGILQRVIVGWVIWELTRSTFWVGAFAFCELFPVVLLGPLAGAAIDRFRPLRVLQASQLIGATQALALFVLAKTGGLDVPSLLAATLVFSLSGVLYGPVTLHLIPRLVPKTDLQQAISINAVLVNAAVLVAPLIAAPVLAVWDAALGLLINAASYAVLLAVLPFIKLNEQNLKPSTGSYWTQVADGYRYVVGNRQIRGVLAIFTVISAGIRSLLFVMPAIAAEVFHGDAQALSILLAAAAAGSIGGGIWVGRRKDMDMARLLTRSTAGLAITLMAFMLSPAVWWGALVVFFLGFALACNGIATQSLVQTRVEEAMAGRVVSLYSTIARGAPALGAFAIGTLATFTGVRAVELTMAVIVVGCWYAAAAVTRPTTVA